MSTIDVANITDAESTTTNSANSSDSLNNTTTVDTKYVTNGCAKAYVRQAGGTLTLTNSLNISSTTDGTDTGQTVVNYTNSFTSSDDTIITVTPTTTSSNFFATAGNVNAASFSIFTRNTSGREDVAASSIIMGDLA